MRRRGLNKWDMSGAFKEFLKRESSRTTFRRIGKGIYIVEGRARRKTVLPTDFLDALLLRHEPSEHVIVEKGLVRELRYRIDELESEVKRLRIVNRVLEAGFSVLILILILVLMI